MFFRIFVISIIKLTKAEKNIFRKKYYRKIDKDPFVICALFADVHRPNQTSAYIQYSPFTSHSLRSIQIYQKMHCSYQIKMTELIKDRQTKRQKTGLVIKKIN
jgi:hypothetical protein